MLTSNPNKWNSTLMSGTSGGTAPTYAICTRVNYLILTLSIYAVKLSIDSAEFLPKTKDFEVFIE